MKPSGYGLDLVQKRCHRPPSLSIIEHFLCHPLHQVQYLNGFPETCTFTLHFTPFQYYFTLIFSVKKKKIHEADERERWKKRLSEGKRDKLSESVEQKHIMMWMDYRADQKERGEYGYTRCKGGCAWKRVQMEWERKTHFSTHSLRMALNNRILRSITARHQWLINVYFRKL